MQNTSGICFSAFTGRNPDEATRYFSPNATDDVQEVLRIISSATAKKALMGRAIGRGRTF